VRQRPQTVGDPPGQIRIHVNIIGVDQPKETVSVAGKQTLGKRQRFELDESFETLLAALEIWRFKLLEVPLLDNDRVEGRCHNDRDTQR